MANEIGLYDMSGNVNEWCFEWSSATTANYPSSDTDPTGEASGSTRADRGGAWKQDDLQALIGVDSRSAISPFFANDIIGFRVLMSGP